MRLLLLFLLPAVLTAQVDSSLYERSELQDQDIADLYRFKKQTEQRLQHIQLNLKEHHRVYKNGVVLNIVGALVSMAAVPLYGVDPVIGGSLSGAGGVLVLAGAITTIRSHRFIGRAGE